MVKSALFLKMIKGIFKLGSLPKRAIGPLRKSMTRIIDLIMNNPLVTWLLKSRLAVSLPIRGINSTLLTSQTGDMITYYLPNEKVLQINKTIEKQPDIVLPTQILDDIIDKAEHFYELNLCFCRFLNDCKDYSYHIGCLYVGKSVLDIKPSPLGHHITKEEAHAQVKKAREMGLVHMIGKTAPESYFLEVNDDSLLTVCHCCPCCCAISLFEYAPKELSKICRKLPGVTVKVDKDKCVGCKTCIKDGTKSKVCFVNAIHIIKGKGKGNDKAIIDQDYCKACGRCVLVCPKKAIEMTFSDDRYPQKTMRELERRLELFD